MCVALPLLPVVITLAIDVDYYIFLYDENYLYYNGNQSG